MKITKVETIARTPFISLEKRNYIDTVGNEKEWYMVSRNNNTKAVVIVATNRDEIEPRIVVTKEFRVPIGDYEWGLPAGLIDDGEDVETTVKRELKEETGLDVTYVEKISPFVYNSAGLTDEAVAMAFVHVEGDISDEMHEASEEIETFLMTPDEVAELLNDDEIKFGAKAWMAFDYFARTGDI